MLMIDESAVTLARLLLPHLNVAGDERAKPDKFLITYILQEKFTSILIITNYISYYHLFFSGTLFNAGIRDVPMYDMSR